MSEEFKLPNKVPTPATAPTPDKNFDAFTAHYRHLISTNRQYKDKVNTGITKLLLNMGRFKQHALTKIVDLTFKMYSDEEITKLSVVNITCDESINSLGHYLQDGIYDLRMGPMSIYDDEICKTCFNKARACSGHCGHIVLPIPIFNPFLVKELEHLLKKICPSCCRVQVLASRALQFIYECKLMAEGYITEALQIGDLIHFFLGDEAEEVNFNGDDSYVKESVSKKVQKKESPAKNLKLKENLEKFYLDVKGSRPPDYCTTSNTQFAYQSLSKKFQADSKVGTADLCCFCKTRLLNLLYENYQLSIKNYKKICFSENKEDSFQASSIIQAGQPYLTSEQAKTILRNCWKNESTLLKNMYPVLDRDDVPFPTDLFFIQNLMVIPPKFRPCNVTRGLVIQHDLSILYGQILSFVKCLRFLVSNKDNNMKDIPDTIKFLIKEFKGETWIEKAHSVWNELQKLITFILDTSGNRLTTISKGIRQVIEKKFGLFRQNLMGKRVNFSARSVAAPDPMLAVDEVGVPRDFAIKLSYPVPVNSHNVHELRELVINGPDNHPGAIMVEDEEGKKTALKANDESSRTAIANGLLTSAESCVNRVNASKIVYRHLKTGDWVLMNRQPTLHKPSIQAHKARVTPKDKVLRMPYANCKAYNADFDGDELNMHFPQNELARGECQGLVTTQNQYLTPRDGTPLAGLIQDCVVASVTLSKRGVFFIKADYQQLVFVGVSDLHRGKIKFLPPSIIKPQKLWSGKQVFSTVILNLIPEKKAKPTMTFKTAVKVDLWQEVEARPCLYGGEPEKKNVSMTESEFILRDGELLCGVIDKCAIGSTSHGLVHTCHDLYGGAVSSNILTSVGRMSVWYLQWSGHTICLKEFVTPPEVSKKRRKELKSLIKRAPGEVCKRLEISIKEFPKFIERHHLSKNEKEMAIIDAAYTGVLGPVTSRVTSENEKGLYRNNLNNRMRMMVDTGAKGSKVNMNQMASLFGSVALDGKRMTMSITGKTLPSFKPYDPSPRAGGYIPTRFVTGMDPKSYFFLCVVGRDSLQHTAVKTANSGYTQRCLIKHLEGLKVCYDLTVRNSDNVVMQFNYGEDGLEVTKVPFLKDSNTLNTLVDNYSRLFVEDDINKLCGDERKLRKHKKKIMKYKEQTKYLPKTRTSGFVKFCKEIESNFNEKKYSENGLNLAANMWHQTSSEEREKYNFLIEKCPEPVNAKYRFSSSSSLEGVSEALDDLIISYYEDSYCKRPLAEQYLTKKEVTQTIRMKVLNSKVEPGEPVGALCAQALGEPLTQMTLNTFHFAGRDELNVTLGVPRMREILQMASDDSMMTPIMECPFHSHVSLAAAEALKKQLTPVELNKVVQQVNIEWALQMQYKLYRHTVIEFHFLPHKQYKKMLPLTPYKILEYMEKFYIRRVLIRQIVLAMQKANTYGADFLLKKMDKKEREADENEAQIQVPTNLEVNEGSSDEEDNAEEVDDLGIAGSKWQEKGQEQDYNEDDEEVESNGFLGSDTDADENEGAVKVEIKHSEDEGFVDDRHDEEDIKTPSSSKKKVKKVEKIGSSAKVCRINKVIAQDGWIQDYDYDEANMEWCKVTLCLPIAEGKYDLSSILRTTIDNTLIYSVPNIKKALVVQNDNGILLRTEGVNIDYILRFENYLDVNRLYTNNIHIMGRKFGIEAAQRSIIKEIRAVQSAYDIKVDFRHLSLLADYFTCEGKYKACSRHDLNNCASPIQKMSYETCFAFLKSALLQGHSDDMSSPSACVMAGQPVKVGTNAMFDIMCKLNGNCIK